MYNNNPNNMSNQNINLMTHFSPLRTPSRLLSATRTVVLSLVCLVAALLLPSTATAQNPYAVIDGNVMTLYYGTDMADHEGAFDVTEKFNGAEEWPEAVYEAEVQKVIFHESFAGYRPTFLGNLFGYYVKDGSWVPGFLYLQKIEGIEHLNTEDVTVMSFMFFYCWSLQSLDLSSFNTENVTDMRYMFGYCRNLRKIDVSSFNTEKVGSLRYMFSNCSSLRNVDLSSFSGTLDYTFEECEKLTTVTLGEKIEEIKPYAFKGCFTLRTINAKSKSPAVLADWATNWEYYRHTRLNVPVGSLDAYLDSYPWNKFKYIHERAFEIADNQKAYLVLQDKVMTLYAGDALQQTQIEGAIDASAIFQGIGDWPVEIERDSIVKVMLDPSFANLRPSNGYYLFSFFKNLLAIEGLQYLNTERVTDMANMFAGCISLKILDLKHFSTSNVKNMRSMFMFCDSLESLDVSNFDTRAVDDMARMFERCGKLKCLNLSSFNTSKVTTMFAMFSDCQNLASLDISSFNTSQVTDMSLMFFRCESLESLDVSSFNTSKVEEMQAMFNYCTRLEKLDLSNFNTAKVTKMQGMFNFCTSLQHLDLSSFETSNVTDMRLMFQGCFELQTLDVSSFDTRNVTDMSYMFSICRKLKSLELSKFNTENVTDMKLMFQSCNELKELDVSSFNTEKVTEMFGMFSSCEGLRTLDLSSFSTASIERNSYLFSHCFNLEKVILGTDFKKMDKNIFFSCPALTSINAMAVTPEATADSAFSEAQFETVRLNVPIGSLGAYKNTPDWNKFVKIREVDFAHVVEIDPLEENQEVTFGNGDIKPETDLGGTVVGNVYYNVESNEGGYDAAGGCIVINKATNDSQLSAVQGEELGSDEFKDAFTGLVVMVPAGAGVLKVTAESVGGMVLKVKIGNKAASTYTLTGKVNAEFPYDVAENTYIYIYGGDAAAQARARRNVAAADKALKIYGVSWTKNVSDGIDTVDANRQPAVIYNLRGQRVKTMDKGVYIVNGKKVVVQ